MTKKIRPHRQTQYYCWLCKRHLSKAHKAQHYQNKHQRDFYVLPEKKMKLANILPWIRKLNKHYEVIKIKTPFKEVLSDQIALSTSTFEDQILFPSIDAHVGKIRETKFLKKRPKSNNITFFQLEGQNSYFCLPQFRPSFFLKFPRDAMFCLKQNGASQGNIYYCMKGAIKWWVCASSKTQNLKEILEKNVGDHGKSSCMWIDGDSLMKKFPQLCISSLSQNKGQLVILRGKKLIFWGRCSDDAIVEANKINFSRWPHRQEGNDLFMLF